MTSIPCLTLMLAVLLISWGSPVCVLIGIPILLLFGSSPRGVAGAIIFKAIRKPRNNYSLLILLGALPLISVIIHNQVQRREGVHTLQSRIDINALPARLRRDIDRDCAIRSTQTVSVEKAAEAAAAAVELEALNAPPHDDPAVLERHRASTRRRVARYRGRGRILTVEELVKAQLRLENPALEPETLDRPLRDLAPLLKRFDWRSLKVVPWVRDQGDCNRCWALVATEAFESSLMIQQANFGFRGVDGVFIAGRISLSDETTIDSVPPRDCSALGRHELAFKHFFDFGVPLTGLNLVPENDRQDRDFKLGVGNCTGKKKTGIKAIGWGYVHLPPHETPTEQEMKEALLEHGPLVAMVSNDGFHDYRHPDNDDDAIHTEKGFLEYPEDTAPVFETDTQKGTNHSVLIIGWDDTKTGKMQPSKGSWIIQNTFGTKWGYQCDGPRVMSGDFRSEDRGFMYIRYGSNSIGQFAGWIEAPLLTQRWMEGTENSESNLISEALPQRGRSATKSAASKRRGRSATKSAVSKRRGPSATKSAVSKKS